jgi:hypothetical protein
MAAPLEQNVNDIYLPDRVGHNADILYRARTAIALFSGSVAGILGFTNLAGFGIFLVCAIFADVMLLQIACKSSAERYLPVHNRDFFSFGSLTTGILTFVMAWLVFYNVLFVF